MKVELSGRAHREMERINASWRKRADFRELFLDELLETVELIETTGVLGAPYNVKAKHRVSRLLMEKSEYHVYLVRRSDEWAVFDLERSSAPRSEALRPQAPGHTPRVLNGKWTFAK